MPRVLVTGMSGTGKSTVLVELAKRGHRIVDTDYGGWCEDVTSPDGSGSEQLWREDRMSALLAEDVAEPLFVSGCTSNQGKFYDRFDAVVLLTLPVDVLLERVVSRVSNTYGKDPAERERIMQHLDTVEPLLRATSTVEIDATRPLQEVVDTVEALALGDRAPVGSEAMAMRDAACSCGQLRLTAEGDPIRISMCHCLACQRRTGSAFGIQARFPSNRVHVAGRHSDYVRVSDEGEERTFHFCPDCGATVFYELATAPDVVAVPIGAFADPTFPPPRISVWESRRHAWVALPPAVEHHAD